MRKVISLLTALILLFLSFSELSMGTVKAEVNGPEVYGAAYCVMNGDTGDVILSKNQNEKLYPASITKVMTALLVLEDGANLSDTITFSKTALQISSKSSTLTPRAQEGEQMTVENALYGLMLTSANECANALAEYNAGSIEAFVQKMNERAQAIGAVDTHFMNTHGLHDENHYTTAYDIALIFREAIKNEDFIKISNTGNYYIPKTNKEDTRFCESGHRMILGTMPCDGVFSGKSGHTSEAGRTLLTAAKRDNVTVITSLLKSNENNYYNDTQILMDYGFGSINGTYAPVSWTPTGDTVWANADVKVRCYPSSYAQQAGILKSAQAIQRVAVYGDWSRVKLGNAETYIESKYLSATKQEAADASRMYEAEQAAATVSETVAETETQTETAIAAVQTQTSGSFLASMKTKFGSDFGIITALGAAIIIVLISIVILLFKKDKK